jgi:hypothetical protein
MYAIGRDGCLVIISNQNAPYTTLVDYELKSTSVVQALEDSEEQEVDQEDEEYV